MILASFVVSAFAGSFQPEVEGDVAHEEIDLRTETSAAPADEGGVPVRLDNYENEPPFWVIGPNPGEEGQWAAVRFAATQELVVERIEATFVRQPPQFPGGFDCSVDLPHDVIVFTSPDLTPPADPDVLFRTTVPAMPNHPPGRVVVDIAIPKPITVPAGHNVYVALEQPGTFPKVVCIMFADGHPDQDETEFWSFATDAPFAWTGFDDLRNFEKAAVSISGYWRP